MIFLKVTSISNTHPEKINESEYVYKVIKMNNFLKVVQTIKSIILGNLLFSILFWTTFMNIFRMLYTYAYILNAY